MSPGLGLTGTTWARLREVPPPCPGGVTGPALPRPARPSGRTDLAGPYRAVLCRTGTGRVHRRLWAFPAGAMAETILVTGGAGYIGSHCVLELLQAGYVPVVIDNFHNAIRGTGAPSRPRARAGPGSSAPHSPPSIPRLRGAPREPPAGAGDRAPARALPGARHHGPGGAPGALQEGESGSCRARGGSRGPWQGWEPREQGGNAVPAPVGAPRAGRAGILGNPGGIPARSCCRAPDPSPFPLQHRFSAVMHFAGLKAVGESVQKPLEYYRVNLTGTIGLLEVRGAGGDPGLLPLPCPGPASTPGGLAQGTGLDQCCPLPLADHEGPRREEHRVQQLCHRLWRPQVPPPG